MADLIDRQALLKDIEQYHLSDGKFQHWVEVQPSVDAVEVVRCKNCIHYEARQKNQPWKSSRKYCNRQVILCTEPNDFCSYGERKTDGSD